jgi:hypothetical protein
MDTGRRLARHLLFCHFMYSGALQSLETTIPIKIMLGDGLSSLARNLGRCVIWGALSFLLETAI